MRIYFCFPRYDNLICGVAVFCHRLVLVCIYVTPVKHIYTGIKYIALYNIIYVCGIKGIFFNEGKGKGLSPGNAASPV